MLQDARDKVLIDKTIVLLEIAYGCNLQNRTFEQMLEMERVAESFLREWRGIGVVDAFGVVAELWKKQNNLKSETIDSIAREYFDRVITAV